MGYPCSGLRSPGRLTTSLDSSSPVVEFSKNYPGRATSSSPTPSSEFGIRTWTGCVLRQPVLHNMAHAPDAGTVSYRKEASMHARKEVPKIMAAVAAMGRFLRRRKRAVIALLVIGPLLLTGNLDVFILNLVGLGFGALLLRQMTLSRTGRRMAAQRQTAETTVQTDRRTR